MNVTPHVAQNTNRPGGSAIDARTTRHGGYGISQRKRKRIEESFGWLKTIALMRKVRSQWKERVAQPETMHLDAHKHLLVEITDRQPDVIHTCRTEQSSLRAGLRGRRCCEYKERIAPGHRVMWHASDCI